jgi:hypothetical protein
VVVLRKTLIKAKNYTRNFKPFVRKRQDLAMDIQQAVIEIAPAGFFEKGEAVVSIGGGHGENPYAVSKLMSYCDKIIVFDPIAEIADYLYGFITVYSFGKKFQNMTADQEKLLQGHDFIWEMSNVLQTMYMNEKEAVLRLMRKNSRYGQKAVVVDEIMRDKLDGIVDIFCNLFYNPDQIIYDRLTAKEYVALFERCGFRVVKSKNYHRGLVVYLLEAV